MAPVKNIYDFNIYLPPGKGNGGFSSSGGGGGTG